MSDQLKIYSQRCWVDGKLQPAMINVADGKIISVSFEKDADAIDAGDNILMPGLIDAHVHINEPGRTGWEGFITATNAAAAGGITTLVDMPLNSSPVTVSVQALEEKKNASTGKMQVNLGFYGGLVPGNAGEMEALCRAGVSGVKCFLVHSGIDEFPNAGWEDLEAAMPVLARYGVPLLVHAEVDAEAATCDFDNQPTCYREYVKSRPDSWETAAIEKLISLCRKYRCPVHIVHVSSAESLPLISEAKKEGLPLTAETCPHYIYFNAEDIPDGKTVFKCAPPIRDRENNRLLRQTLSNGVLDFIATDHSPAPPDIKELDSGNLKKAWGGIAGLQLFLPVSWTALRGEMSVESFIPLVTERPARFIGADGHKGFIKPGFDADLVIWSPDQAFEVSTGEILHRHKACPYTGCRLYGEIKMTIVNGSVVFADHALQQKNKGQWLLRK